LIHIKNDLELLDVMLRDQSKQLEHYRPGLYWEDYSSRMIKAVRSDGLEDFRSNVRIGKGFVDAVLMDPFDLSSPDSWKSKLQGKIVRNYFLRKYLIDHYVYLNNHLFKSLTQKYQNLYYTNMLSDWFSEFSTKYNLPDTLVGNPQDTVSISNHKMGRMYLSMYSRIHNYSKVVDFSQVKVVFEIGGGFGAFAHTLLHIFPNIRKYIYLDLPSTLYVATQYLKHFFGNEVTDYRETKNLDRILFSSNNEREILSVCPWQIEKIDADVDLFWNSASFQEMPKATVVNYLQYVERLLKNGKQPKFCLFLYSDGKQGKKIEIEDAVEICSENTSFKFEEVEPEIKIDLSESTYCFVGKHK